MTGEETNNSTCSRAIGGALFSVSRPALGAWSLGHGLAALRAGGLGLACPVSPAATSGVVCFLAGHQLLYTGGGTCRGRLGVGSHPRIVPGFGRGCGARLSGSRRTGSLRPQSAAVHLFLALFASAVGGPLGVRAYLRSMVTRGIAGVREVAAGSIR